MRLIAEPAEHLVYVTVDSDTLDAGNAHEFRRHMAPVLDASTKMVLDLERVEFVDSSGLGGILSCLRHLSAKGGELVLCGVCKPVRALFEMARLHHIIDIAATRSEAERLLR